MINAQMILVVNGICDGLAVFEFGGGRAGGAFVGGFLERRAGAVGKPGWVGLNRPRRRNGKGRAATAAMGLAI